MTSQQYFANILVQISPKHNKLDIFYIYTERAVEKCPRWIFQTPRKPRNSINKSGNSFGGHPVYTWCDEFTNMYTWYDMCINVYTLYNIYVPMCIPGILFVLKCIHGKICMLIMLMCASVYTWYTLYLVKFVYHCIYIYHMV